jgi:hypothetical protein
MPLLVVGSLLAGCGGGGGDRPEPIRAQAASKPSDERNLATVPQFMYFGCMEEALAVLGFSDRTYLTDVENEEVKDEMWKCIDRESGYTN